MKMRIVLILLVLPACGLNAQISIYLGAGYNFSSHSNTPRLNYIIDEYNTSRPWLSKKMDKPYMLSGYCFSAGGYINKFMWDISWVGKHKTVTAEGIGSNGMDTKRDLKLRANTINFGFGYRFNKFFAIGASIDAGEVNFFTTSYAGNDPGTYYSASSSVVMGMTIFPQFMIPISKKGYSMIVIKPYYQMMLWNAKDDGLDVYINPNTYFVNYSSLPEGDKFSNYGLEIKLQLALFGYGD